MESSRLSVARNLAHQTAHASDWKEEMPYRISYIDTSMLTDEQITEGILRTEEFPTEPRRSQERASYLKT